MFMQAIEPSEIRIGRQPFPRFAETQVFYLGYGRNAWNATWINRYDPGSMSFNDADLRTAAEARRVQGSVSESNPFRYLSSGLLAARSAFARSMPAADASIAICLSESTEIVLQDFLAICRASAKIGCSFSSLIGDASQRRNTRVLLSDRQAWAQNIVSVGSKSRQSPGNFFLVFANVLWAYCMTKVNAWIGQATQLWNKRKHV